MAARKQAPDVYRGTNHGHFPPGPAGRFYWLPAWNSCVMKYSKNQQVAEGVHPLLHGPRPVRQVRRDHGHLRHPGTKVYFDHPVWTKDPKTTVFRETLQSARQVGHAGPAGRKATEALSKYVLVDMFARSLRGDPGGRGEVGGRGAAQDLRRLTPAPVPEASWRSEVHLFANPRRLRTAGGRGRAARVELPEGATVRDLLRRLQHSRRGPRLFLVNGRDVDSGATLRSGDVVDVLPPLVGGW